MKAGRAGILPPLARPPQSPRPTISVPYRLAPLALLFALPPAFAQDDPVAALPGTAAERITADLQVLASDAFEGRGPGTEGIDRAADYIRDGFAGAGLKGAMPDGGFFQPFEITLGSRVDPANCRLVLTGPDGGSRPLTLGGEYQPLAYGGEGAVGAELVFAGFGITAPEVGYDDFAGLDVAGKIAVVLRREPRQTDPESPFNGAKTSRYSYIRTKLKAAQDAGAGAVLLVNDAATVAAEGDELSDARAFGGPSFDVPFGQITRALADQLLAARPLTTRAGLELTTLDAVENEIDAALAPVGGPLAFTGDLKFAFETEAAPVKNVVAVLEGSGPHADETVVLGAHYDHLGFGGRGSRAPGSNEVHNGADDNASGTSLLMELARRYGARAEAGDPPARRMVFIAFSGEERGLLGSKHYVNEDPLFPLETTRAMLNFDMVGRSGENAFQLHGISSSPAFPALVNAAAARSEVVVDRVDGVLNASDHWDFVQKNIPSFHFFTGLTPQYHSPTDDVETLNIRGIADIADFAERLADPIIAGDEPLAFVEPPMARLDGRAAAAGRPVLGVLPADVTPEGGGVTADEVVADGPAEKAGLKAGDVVTAVKGVPVADLVGLTAALNELKVGQTVPVDIRREDGSETTVNVTLGAGG